MKSTKKSRMKKILKLWVNGEKDLFLNTETGEVAAEITFPCSTPGRDFMKSIHRKYSCGSIGKEGVDYILSKIKESKIKPHPGYDGWAGHLYPFWNATQTELSPGFKRITL
jgi:hypothetical protein